LLIKIILSGLTYQENIIMPFTPLHMGPGILIKVILQSSFSLMVFGWTQILMDIQPLIVMLTGEGHLHGFTHTYLGGSLIAIIAALTGKYLSEFGLVFLGIATDKRIVIAWWITFLSAFIGSFSHVLLDNIMHFDVQPFYPFSMNSGLFQLVSISTLHKICVYTGLIGAALYYIINWKITKKGFTL